MRRVVRKRVRVLFISQEDKVQSLREYAGTKASAGDPFRVLAPSFIRNESFSVALRNQGVRKTECFTIPAQPLVVLGLCLCQPPSREAGSLASASGTSVPPRGPEFMPQVPRYNPGRLGATALPSGIVISPLGYR